MSHNPTIVTIAVWRYPTLRPPTKRRVRLAVMTSAIGLAGFRSAPASHRSGEGASDCPEDHAELRVEDRSRKAEPDDGELERQDDGGQVSQRVSRTIDGRHVRQSAGRRKGAAIEQPHQDPAVEQPAGDLNLDMDGRCVPHGRIR